MVDEPQTKAALPPMVAVTSPSLAVVRFHGRRTELMNNCYANYGTTNARELATLLAEG